MYFYKDDYTTTVYAIINIKMAKKRAFCNNICETLNIAYKQYNYVNVIKTKRITRIYIVVSANSDDENIVNMFMKL